MLNRRKTRASPVERRSLFCPSFNRSGAGSVEEMVGAALEELLPDFDTMSGKAVELAIVRDLSKYAGDGWVDGLPGEVFAEAFRVWQEGGKSHLAAILGPMVDAALKGVA